jgi:DNA helicase-2/ATP-dependent DNA helicase PcrA
MKKVNNSKTASESIFNELYAKLNQAQRQAVDAIEGPVMVIAGPGTGKTTILTLRIANILKKTDTEPGSILALTFTESGVNAMRKKLLSIIGLAAYKVHIHTFHGFCNEIIKSYPQDFPKILGSTHISDVEQLKIFEKIFDKEDLPSLYSKFMPYYHLKGAMNEIKDLKREDITPKEFKEIIKQQEKTLASFEDLYHEKGKYKGQMKGDYLKIQKKIDNNKDLLTIYEAYESELEKNRFYDFEDMIMEVLRVLRVNNDLLLILQENYQYVLADEHQDANNAQNKLLELISSFHESPNLFIVGDEKQAIFRFQGASIENFLYFQKRFKNAKVIPLVENFRSTQNILDAAHSLIVNNEINVSDNSDLRIKLLSMSSNSSENLNEKISIHECESEAVERVYVASKIAEFLQSGVNPEEIAVFYHDNRHGAKLSLTLKDLSIPHTIHSDIDLFSDAEIKKLMFLLEAVSNISNDTYLAQLLFVDFLNLQHLDIFKLLNSISKKRSESKSLFEIIGDKDKLQELEITSPDAFIELHNKLKSLAVSAKNKSLVEIIKKIEEDFEYVKHIFAQSKEKDGSSLEEKLFVYDAFLEQVAKVVERNRSANLDDFISHVATLKEHNINIKVKNSLNAGKVNLMTAHKSKGLEFDIAFIIGVNHGNFGGKRHRSSFSLNLFEEKDESGVSDDRRLLYVAMTRARLQTHITYANKSDSGKDLLPSQFINELDLNHVSHVDTQYFKDTYTKLRVRSGSTVHSEPEKIDTEYIYQTFLEKGLSVSALNNYLECPWTFIFKNIICIPQIADKHLLYGTAVHETLKVFFDKRRVETDLSKKEFLSLFVNFLNQKPLNQKDFDNLKKEGQENLAGYYDTYHKVWNKNVLTEFSVSTELELPDMSKFLIKGNLDKIEILPDDSVNVVDYKTGKVRPRYEIESGNYKRQLVFYKMLLDLAEDKRFHMVSGEIDFVNPDQNGQFKKEAFSITEEDVGGLKEAISKMLTEVKEGAYLNTCCDDAKCEFCALSKII